MHQVQRQRHVLDEYHRAAGVAENLVVEEGRTVNSRFSTCLIPGIGDIPLAVESIIIEIPDPRGPSGARGLGEMPLIPFAPAVAAALYDATGVWFDRIPLAPDRVMATVDGHAAGKKGRR